MLCSEGHNLRQSAGLEEEEEQVFSDAYDEELGDEDLLGESTLAKLRDSKLFGDDEETAGEVSAEAGGAGAEAQPAAATESET